MKLKKLLTRASAAMLALSLFAARPADLRADDAEAAEAPRLTLDKSERIVANQLKRHTNAQLIAVERSADDAKFRPVYLAILTRKGLEKKYREEAVASIAKIDKSDAVVVLLDAIGKVEADDNATPRELAGLLLAQKPAALSAQKERLTAMAKESESAIGKRAAYAALATVAPREAWTLASDNHALASMLGGIPIIADAKVREAFYPQVTDLAAKAPDEPTQVAALEALSAIPGKEAEAFKLLGDTVQKGSGEAQAAAVRSLGRIPASKWPADQVEPLAASIVKLIDKTPTADRTKPAGIQAVQLGYDLAGALGADKGAPIRKQLRDLAPRVVVIHTILEKMSFDLHYFTVQAGKPVQVILDNAGDSMPHNIVITKPGQLVPVALEAGTMTQPADPTVKAFIPASPNVLESSHLVQPGESEALSFIAPAKPGNYPFLCSYPGHYVRMYGVMQVVPDLDAYDKAPTPPKDPMNRTPYKSAKNEGDEGAPMPGHEGHQH